MNVCVPAYPVLPGVVAVSAGEDVLVEADDGEDVGVQQELAVADDLGRELPHPRLPVGKVHRHLQVGTFLSEIELNQLCGYPLSIHHPVFLSYSVRPIQA